MVQVNWDEMFDNAEDFSPAPPGDYVAFVKSAEWKETKSGKSMLAYRFEISAGPERGKLIFGNIVISPESPVALSIGLRHLAALGLTKDLLKSLSEVEQCERILGNVIEITVKHREWQGQAQADVADIRPSDAEVENAPASSNNPPPVADVPPAAAPETSAPPEAPFSS